MTQEGTHLEVVSPRPSESPATAPSPTHSASEKKVGKWGKGGCFQLLCTKRAQSWVLWEQKLS